MFYRHFKGKYYQKVGEALDTATEGTVVVYRTLYPSGHALYTRPLDEFYGEKQLPDGTVVKRFVSIPFEDLPSEAAELVTKELQLPLAQF